MLSAVRQLHAWVNRDTSGLFQLEAREDKAGMTQAGSIATCQCKEQSQPRKQVCLASAQPPAVSSQWTPRHIHRPAATDTALMNDAAVVYMLP